MGMRLKGFYAQKFGRKEIRVDTYIRAYIDKSVTFQRAGEKEREFGVNPASEVFICDNKWHKKPRRDDLDECLLDP